MDALRARVAAGANIFEARDPRWQDVSVGRVQTSTYARRPHPTSVAGNIVHDAGTATHAATATRVNAGILATATRYNGYYGNSTDRIFHDANLKTWQIALIWTAIGLAILGFLVGMFFFVRFCVRRRGRGAYRNITKPAVGEREHEAVFDARVARSLEVEGNRDRSTSRSRLADQDYSHPYGEVDTSYRGGEKFNDQGA